MDFRQLSSQIDTPPTGGELKAFGGGDPLGAPSQEGGFSTVLQNVSRKADDNWGANPRVPQAELNRSSSMPPVVHHSQSRKSDSNTDAEPRDSQAETDAKPFAMMPAVHRTVSRKANGSTDSDPRDPQAKSDDKPSTTTADVPVSLSPTTSGTDSAPPASQTKTNDALSTTTLGSDPLLLSLLGATMVAPALTGASTPPSAGTDALTSHADGLSGISGTPTIQPIAQTAEGITSVVGTKTGLSDLVGHKAPSTTGEAVAALSASMPAGQPRSAGTETAMLIAEKSDMSQGLAAQQGQEAQRNGPHQQLSIMEHQAESLPQPVVPSGLAAANGQASPQPATVVTPQPTRQNPEGVVPLPDRLLAQQILGKNEPSLHQRNMVAESSETQIAAALSGHTSTDGQGSNQTSDGQRKEDGLKWFSQVDLQSAEISSRQPQQSVVTPLDSGSQYLPNQQGHVGTFSTSQSAPTPTVSSSVQANLLRQDSETSPVPVTHAVQFDLAPSDFGQLRVRVVLSDQTIHTHMSTDRAELGQMLTDQQGQLNTQLTAAGLDLGRFQVQVDQERTSHSRQDWQSQSQDSTSQQQRDPRQQDHPQDVPVPVQQRTGMLSLFA